MTDAQLENRARSVRRRRRRAFRLMQLVTLVCVVTALALGAHELHAHGLTQFLVRPPGIGASPK